MLLSPRKNGLTSLFKEVRVFKETATAFLSFLNIVSLEVGPAAVLSHKCDILSLLKDDQLRATIACQYTVGTSRLGDIVL